MLGKQGTGGKAGKTQPLDWASEDLECPYTESLNVYLGSHEAHLEVSKQVTACF